MTPGKYYQVPCVKAIYWLGAGNIWVPVYGPKHVDKGFFEHEHYHADPRFVGLRGRRFQDNFVDIPAELRRLYITPILAVHIVEGPVMKRRKCRREFDPFMAQNHPKKWRKWQSHYHGKVLTESGLCPHKGSPVCKVDGGYYCPMHGLVFDEDGVCRHRDKLKLF